MLGIWNASLLALERGAGLVARLTAVSSLARRRRLPADVCIFALRQPGSWTASLSSHLEALGVPDLSSWGVGAGVSQRRVQQWHHCALRPALHSTFCNEYVDAVSAIPSLTRFAEIHPNPGALGFPFTSVALADWTRWWSLAQCGHHPCCDGRAARHRGSVSFECSCGFSACSLAHVLAHCPLTAALRRAWANRVGLGGASDSIVSEAAIADWIWEPSHSWNTATRVAAHVTFVGHVCLMVSSLRLLSS